MLYLSFIIISSKLDGSKIKDALDPCCTLFERDYFHRCYATAHDFFYNENFSTHFRTEYLGYIREKLPYDLGDARIDLVLNSAQLIDLNSLHMHLLLEHENFGEDELSCALSVTNLIKFIGGVLYRRRDTPNEQPPLRAFHKIVETLDLSVSQRRYTMPFTAYFYISLCNLNETIFNKYKTTNNLRRRIFSLLYLHAKGVSNDIAQQVLENSKWESTNFFVNYYQPGGMISIASKFPPLTYENHASWFIRRRSGKLHDELGVMSVDEPRVHEDEHVDPYDLLPEYPPLCYLGLLSLQHSGFFEENLRQIYQMLLRMHEKTSLWKRLPSLLKNHRDIKNIESLYFRTNNFEYLRLPVVRPLIQNLVDSKLQQNIIENIKELKTSGLSTIIFILTIVATVAAVSAIGPVVLAIWNILSPVFVEVGGLILCVWDYLLKVIHQVLSP